MIEKNREREIETEGDGHIEREREIQTKRQGKMREKKELRISTHKEGYRQTDVENK